MKTLIHSAKFSNTYKKIGEHHHDVHQILFVTNGTAEISINEKVFHLHKNSLIFISRTESHFITRADNNYARYEIRISPEIFSADIKNPQLYSVLLNRPQGFNRIIELDSSQISPILDKIISEQNQNTPYKTEMQTALLDILFINIYRRYPELFSTTENPTFDTVKKIQQQLEQNIENRYSLEELSEQHHISKYYLSHIFKNVTGYSIMDYLKLLRIAKAKTLLSKTNLHITEIVKTCGFSDSSNFSREFKTLTSQTPSEFRKNTNK